MDFRPFLEEIAREAGKITLKYFNSAGLEVISKSDESPVTRADREAEEYLRRRIREHFPNDVILGEEFGTDGTDSSRRWILDPIDGTKSFIHGVPLYGVLIGVEERETIMHGVAYMPVLNEMVSATKGGSCYWNGQPCHTSNVAAIDEALVLTTEDSRLRSRIDTKTYDALVSQAKLYRIWGDCYGHILVATGRAELMLDPKMALWDSSPFGVILEAAGGQVFDLKGTPGIYGDSLVSVNARLAPSVLEILTA